MVLDVVIEGYNERFHSSYSRFSLFRREILRGWNVELGELWELKDELFYNERQCEECIRKKGITYTEFQEMVLEQIIKILNEYDKPYNEGMKIFANHSDADGEITPNECVLVLKSFERVDPNKFDDSSIYDNMWYRDSYKMWIKMLTYAIENNKDITFG